MPPNKAGIRVRRRASSASRSARLTGPSTSRNRRSSLPPLPLPKPSEIFHKCLSEPLLFPAAGSGEERLSIYDSGEVEGGWICRLHPLNDVFFTPPEVINAGSPLSRINAGYGKDTKVVITVTVEGSPGPIKALIKLGASVDDTIKLVIQKYGEEGRTPQLDKDKASFFDLHISYFSLECLDKRDEIGNVGSRSFYLRKSKETSQVVSSSLGTSEVKSIQGSSPNMMVLPPFMTRKIDKMARRVRRLFKTELTWMTEFGIGMYRRTVVCLTTCVIFS